MAVIAMFYGIIVSMYFFDNQRHKTPTFTSAFKDRKLSFRFPTAPFWRALCARTK